MTLDFLAEKYNTDKGCSGHGFTNIYDMILSKHTEEFKKILEIGVFYGASLKMWSDYFPNANIIGCDIDDKTQYDTDRISTLKIDQGNRNDLTSLINDNKPDLIIDDGSHMICHQLLTIGVLFPYLKSGGYYILEDLHTSTTHAPSFYGADSVRNAYKFISDLCAGYHSQSEYMSNEESSYIYDNIEDAIIFSKHNGTSITSIFKKK